ncbi:MAG: efflux RND transporter periplasmic adaptor subunit, partial [Myxococcota bacterium]
GLLRAPFDGTIVSVASEAGEFVGAGQPVVTLSGDVLEVEVEVPETVLVDMAVGDAAAVSLPLQGDRTLQGHITSIGHGGHGPGRLFPVVVALPSEADLVPGMTADFVLERVGAAGVTVPVSAVVDAGGGETSVFAVENGVVQRRSVGVAQLLGADALIAKGVTAGDDIVSGGHFGLVPGQAVQVQR